MGHVDAEAYAERAEPALRQRRLPRLRGAQAGHSRHRAQEVYPVLLLYSEQHIHDRPHPARRLPPSEGRLPAVAMKFKTYVIFYVYLYSFPAFYLISMFKRIIC